MRKHGVPRKIKDLKWSRDGEEISDQTGFILRQMDLLIEVGVKLRRG